MAGEPAIEELLEHLRFRFDDEWAAYYNKRIDAIRPRGAAAQFLQSSDVLHAGSMV